MSSIDKETKVSPALQQLLARSLTEQQQAGYVDTLREILQQPATWRATATMLRSAPALQAIARSLDPQPAAVVLTGSGSSMYIGQSLATTLHRELGVPAQAIPAGTLLTHWRSVLPQQPGLLISIARSGDSPESAGVVTRLLAEAPQWRHLVITCNAQGKLATQYKHDDRVSVLVLDERTNDRSLVMTSSFTNLLLAGTALVQGHRGEISQAQVERVAVVVEQLFVQHADAIQQLAARPQLGRAVYLGSGGALGAAQECALKMLEMTGGKVVTMAETFLGLRHGPMSLVHADTLVFAMLSADPAVRAFELDLLRELSRKQLGLAKLIVGEGIPADVLSEGDVAVELSGLQSPAHAEVPTLLAGIAAGQLLAFFRCLAQGAKPDAPSQGVLTRVVEDFAIHG